MEDDVGEAHLVPEGEAVLEAAQPEQLPHVDVCVRRNPVRVDEEQVTWLYERFIYEWCS